MYGMGAIGGLTFLAFLVFAAAGLVWLVVTAIHGDPVQTRKMTGTIAIVAGTLLVALLIVAAISRPVFGGPGTRQFNGPRPAPGQPVPLPAPRTTP